MQSAALAFGWYRPLMQFAHAVDIVALAKAPGVQEEQLAEPVALAKVPVGQAMQAVDLAAGWW